MPHYVTATLIGVLGLVLNVPLGYWRVSVKKFSKQWFLAVHLSVPLIYLLRIESGLGLKVIPFMVLAAFTGQFLGGRVRKISWNFQNTAN